MWVAKSLLFAGTCSARSELTLVSQRIMRPFRTKQLTVRFPAGCNNLLAIRVYIGQDDQAPTTGTPAGVSLLQDYGQIDSIRGEATQIVLNHVVADLPPGTWLKLYAHNTDYYDHAVDADIEIAVEHPGPE